MTLCTERSVLWKSAVEGIPRCSPLWLEKEGCHMVLGLSEADTRAKLIDPALHVCGWTEDLIRREETAGAIEVINGKPRKRSKGRTDYTLRVKVNSQAQPVAVAL